MLEKKIIHTLLKNLKHGSITIEYWDGTSETFGDSKNPVGPVVIKSRKFARRIFRNVSLGVGEGYMNGDLEIKGDFTKVFNVAMQNMTELRKASLSALTYRPNRNKRAKQRKQIAHHYDIGNDFYKLWLDKSMTYSCAYFKSPRDSLETAQQQKIDHLLRKLQLKKGMSLLDIGSGWGNLLITAAKKYKVKGLGITLSEEQLKHSRAKAKEAGVDKLVKFRLMNFQDLAEQKQRFDRIISVGMFEHVGKRNQASYYKAISTLLHDGGISVLHTISVDANGKGSDNWMDKYIFPGGFLPHVPNVAAQLEKHGFQVVDYENLRLHYAMTLNHWWKNFEKNKDKVIDMFDERFYRMWRFYLVACEANFRYGSLGLSQFVFTKGINNDLPLTREHLYR